MESTRVLQLWIFACFASAVPARGESHLIVTPESPVLEMGMNFTATCLIINTNEITADDLYWNMSEITISKEFYTKINRTALSVTIPITSEKPEWLFCRCKKESAYVVLNKGKFIHGILLRKGYRPVKPENLSCVAHQEGKLISPTITCGWKTVGHQTPEVPTIYTLHVVTSTEVHNLSTTENEAQITMSVFPFYMTLEVWVEASNKLGIIESEHLSEDAGCLVKPNPPSNVRLISEESFPTSLLINWTQDLDKAYLKFQYRIRYCQNGSQSWNYVPLSDTNRDIESFRLQSLQPYTVYVTQVSCKNLKNDSRYWSDWSTNATQRTPEDEPKSVPDLWKIITEGNHINERRVTFICKDPVFANGRIIRFDIKIWDQKDEVKNESIPVSSSEADSHINQQKVLREMILPNDKGVKVSVTASNSVGTSGPANLAIPVKGHELPPVEDLKVWPEGGQLWVKWEHSRRGAVEYVVEWVSGGQIDWQRESKNTNKTVIKGHLQKYVRYTVSVYPVYRRQHGLTWEVGRSTSKEAYLEQGVPLEGPIVRLKGQPGRNEAELEWNEIPQSSRQGFIINYTIFYTNGTKLHEKTVPANTTSYTLKQLTGNTKYDTWINVSTIRGSARGYNHSFTTLKYAPGEIEGIVVGVSFCFLFVVVLTMLLCVYKRDVIKKNFWPQIPNPGESTIGNWSPDYPVKAETPKENCMSGISVLDVDVCDGKCVFEDDKASLSLKKGKYLSEEHSSGIGGSSCMSSPRQSVSDSDEGGDMAETTASTVQYSSVVPSSGYKGQTPSSHPQQAIFSRSESTQPLLDSEENQDMLLQEGSRQSQRFPRQPCFPHTTGNEDSTNQLEMEEREVLEPLDFCPLEEDSEQTMPADGRAADWLPVAPASSYMPQLGGYRPQ